MILALICIGLPIAILAFFLWECHQHQRELDKAERDLNGPARPRFTQWVGRADRSKISTPEKK